MIKFLWHFLLLAAVAGLAVGITKAYFSDQATSTNNTFAAGTLDLKLSDSDESIQDSVSASLGGSDMVPGGSPVSGSIKLRNSGSIPANHAEVAVTTTCSKAEMEKYLEITSLTYDGNGILSHVSDSNGNGYKDLADWEALNGGDGLDGLTLTDLNTDHPLSISIRLASDTPNDYQGESCVATFTATLNQSATQ